MADKDKQPQQKDFDKAFEDVKKGKIQPPRNDDMGPTNPGVEMLKGAKNSYEANKQRMEMEKAMLKGASMGGMGPMQAKKKGGKITAANYDKEYGKIYRKAVKKMAKGGTASSRADGCAVRGKTKA